MADAEQLEVNTIERLGRALMAQMTALTGTRAMGAITVTATGSGNKMLAPNSYLYPVIGDQLRDDLLFKVTPDPAAADGCWTVTGGSTASVGITSNVGGIRHNLASGTTFRFDPPVSDFEATATLDATMTDGSDTGQIVKRVAFFEDLDAGNPQADIFASMLGHYPGILIAWAGSDPAEGLTAGLNQGSTRAGRQRRIFRETFGLYVVVGRLMSDQKRRQEGLLVMQAATRLLSDKPKNIDGEILSTIGAGVEVLDRSRLVRGQRHYVYALNFRCNQTLRPVDSRTFNTWITTQLQAALPGREAPEPTDDLTIVDVTDTMP